MEPVLAKAFAGFKVVAVSAHQIGFSAFFAIGVCWRFRGRKYAIEQDTNKCRLPRENSNQNPKSSSQNRQFVQKVSTGLAQITAGIASTA